MCLPPAPCVHIITQDKGNEDVIESAKIVKRLEKDGWTEVSHTGSHRTFKNDGVAHPITVPHPRRDMPKGLKRAIEKAAGW